MSKDFAWNLFKSTGNVDAFMMMKDMEKEMADTKTNIQNDETSMGTFRETLHEIENTGIENKKEQ